MWLVLCPVQRQTTSLHTFSCVFACPNLAVLLTHSDRIAYIKSQDYKLSNFWDTWHSLEAWRCLACSHPAYIHHPVHLAASSEIIQRMRLRYFGEQMLSLLSHLALAPDTHSAVTGT